MDTTPATPAPPPQDEPIRITTDEVAAAVPPPPRPSSQRTPPPSFFAPPPPRVSQLAVASFVVALLGVPLVGCFLGPVAILLGALGLAQVHSRLDRTGARWAIIGILLGAVDLVGWSIAGYHLLGRPDRTTGRSAVPTLLADPAPGVEIDEAPEQIRRALRANVWVSSEGAAGAVQGSGILVSRTGERLLVLTNRHVVCADGRTPDKVQVRVCDGVTADAAVAWLAPDGIDAAIVEARCLAGERVVPMAVERDVTVRIGDAAFAIGNPLAYEGTYTTGVISSIRSLRAGARSLRVYQTQAPVNPGNSGGGLYTQAGQLIGVNTWATEKQVSEGLGFAIAVEALLDLLEAEGSPLFQEIAGGGR